MYITWKICFEPGQHWFSSFLKFPNFNCFSKTLKKIGTEWFTILKYFERQKYQFSRRSGGCKLFTHGCTCKFTQGYLC